MSEKEIIDRELEMYVLGNSRGRKSHQKRILQLIAVTAANCTCCATAESGEVIPCVNCQSAQFWHDLIKAEFND